jgi:hypothetical protein
MWGSTGSRGRTNLIPREAMRSGASQGRSWKEATPLHNQRFNARLQTHTSSSHHLSPDIAILTRTVLGAQLVELGHLNRAERRPTYTQTTAHERKVRPTSRYLVSPLYDNPPDFSTSKAIYASTSDRDGDGGSGTTSARNTYLGVSKIGPGQANDVTSAPLTRSIRVKPNACQIPGYTISRLKYVCDACQLGRKEKVTSRL